MKIDHITSMPIHVDLLSGFHNLDQLFFTINEVDLENLKSRLLELVQCFKQANLEKLHSFVLYENSPLIYAKDLIPAWANLLNTIPSNDLELLEIRSQTDQVLNQNQLITQLESPNSLSLAHGIARLSYLQFLTIHHLGFDSTLIRILPSLHRLTRLDLHINMDMSNKNVIDELCHNLENCNRLEWIVIYVPAEPIMIFGNVFSSLAKIQTFHSITLHFDSFEKIPPNECFEKLRLIKNLLEVHVSRKRSELNGTNAFYRLGEKLKKIIETFVSEHCRVNIS
jgi:hypothetical protein